MNLNQQIKKLDSWLDSWKNPQGGIGSYIVHHHFDSMQVISPDTWTQSATILAHIELFKKTNGKKWLEKAIEEANYLVNNYIWEKHIYRNSCFEHKPGNEYTITNLIHNTYPTNALLTLCILLKKQNKDFKKFIDVAEDNIKNRILKIHWDKKRKRIERKSNPQDDIFILNMAANAIKSILLLAKLKKIDEKKAISYCNNTAEHILQNQSEEGYFYYDETKTSAPLIYVAITMQGLLDLFEKTNSKKILDSCINAADFLNNQLDKDSGLYYHRIQNKEIIKYPEFIAGAMIIVAALKRIEKFSNKKYDSAEIVTKTVLKKQYSNGAIPNFHVFTDIFMPAFYPPEPEKTKWRDVLPIPGWNALAFEALTSNLKDKIKIIPEKGIKKTIYESEKYLISETQNRVEFREKTTGKIKAKWDKKEEIWLFGEISLRDSKKRVLHLIYLFKNRFGPLQWFLNKFYVFRSAEKPMDEP